LLLSLPLLLLPLLLLPLLLACFCNYNAELCDEQYALSCA